MAVWETVPELATQSELYGDFARTWQAAEKIVYSTTLSEPSTARARIERRFDPDAVRALKAAATSDLTVGGANLAAQAFGAGLVDEVHLIICPVSVGAGKAALPRDARNNLDLVDERHFDNGTVYVGYGVAS